MTFPLAQSAESSAVTVWQRMTNYAQQLKLSASFYSGAGAQGTLDELTILELGRRLKPMSDYFIANAGTTGLQAYARVATGNPVFDLSAELLALRIKINAVYAAGRAAIVILRTDLADDGTVTEAGRQLTAQQAAPFIAACDALFAQID